MQKGECATIRHGGQFMTTFHKFGSEAKENHRKKRKKSERVDESNTIEGIACCTLYVILHDARLHG